MKTKLLLVALFIFSFQQIFSQTPNWEWAKGFDGYISDGNSIATDVFNNVYTTGYFFGTVDFDPGLNTMNLTSGPGINAYISKLDASGNFQWAKSLFGGSNVGFSIVLDASRNVYISGYFKDTVDFDPGPGIHTMNISDGSQKGFILKLDSLGNFLWVDTIGFNVYGSNVYSLVMDNSGSVYASGFVSNSTLFEDAFICKLDPSGNLVWFKIVSTNSTGAYGNSITYGNDHDIYVTGVFSGIVDFDPGSGIYNLNSNDGLFFISKYDSAGNFTWAKNFGGGYNPSNCPIKVDSMGNVYTAGDFYETYDFDPGPGTFTMYGGNTLIGTSSYILKLDSSGNFIWAKQIGLNVNIGSFVLNTNSDIYLVGGCDSASDLDPSLGVSHLPIPGSFLLRLDSAGNFVSVLEPMGANIYAINVDNLNDLYITGTYSPSGAYFGSIYLSNGSTGGDGFIAKLNSNIGSCSIYFQLQADTIFPHTYWITSFTSGVAPLHYLWNWGDGNTDTIPYPSHVYADSGYYNICITITDDVACTSTFCSNYILARMNTTNSSMVYVNVINPATIGIEDIKGSNPIYIFPNPASNHFTISLSNHKKAEVTIADITGKIIYSTATTTQQLEISTKDFADGIYIVQVKGEEFVETKKVIVSK